MTTFVKLSTTAAISALLLAGCANDTKMAQPEPAMEKDAMMAETDTMAMAAEAPAAASESSEPVIISTVGNAPMYSNKDVIANASTADNLTTLVAAVQAAELVETLQGPGPFTIFAPVNSAFDNLPAGTVDTLLKPENKADLQNVLTYHVVSGNFDAEAIMARKGDNLSTSFDTVQGTPLVVNPTSGGDVYVIDGNGNAARVIQSDVYQSNGVVHVIDTVLLPKS